MNPKPALITITPLSDMIQMPIPTIRHHLRTSPETFIPAAKIGKRIYFKVTDVEAWIEKQFETGNGGAA